MEIIIQFVKLPTNDYLESFVTKKLNKLYKKYSWIIKAQVFFKHKTDPKGKGQICEIQLSHIGPKIFAGSNEISYEEAAAETIRDLEIQLEKLKSKMKPYQ
ncbi:HPF/RaiA family ribosome-associated protein [Lutibacter citreus]|uniref:HPF/RaiA family ribosome-associated protein n=1 Tax=Lutibacter citreus TaxID=2138210 RepID=UPI000DBE4902|nr:HPF/RaiA family ribosome-associated protein [Lutibacter citreus]